VDEVSGVRSESVDDQVCRLGVGGVARRVGRRGGVRAVDADVDPIASNDPGHGRGEDGLIVTARVRRSPLDPDRRRVDHVRSHASRLTGNYMYNHPPSSKFAG